MRGLAAGAALVAPSFSSRPPLRDLQHGFAGDVVTPSSSGYDQARPLYSTRFDAIRPRAIVFCETVGDVVHTIRWARRHGVHLEPRSGGHSYGGYSTTSGVVLDVFPAEPRARLRGTRRRRRAPRRRLRRAGHRGPHDPGGDGPSVGIAGLILGGGHGYAVRKLGLTCDALEGLMIVTAAGEVLRCDARRHADLFWACRGGGGGNFGVVTSFTFRATPVGEVATYLARPEPDGDGDADARHLGRAVPRLGGGSPGGARATARRRDAHPRGGQVANVPRGGAPLRAPLRPDRLLPLPAKHSLGSAAWPGSPRSGSSRATSPTRCASTACSASTSPTPATARTM